MHLASFAVSCAEVQDVFCKTGERRVLIGVVDPFVVTRCKPVQIFNSDVLENKFLRVVIIKQRAFRDICGVCDVLQRNFVDVAG